MTMLDPTSVAAFVADNPDLVDNAWYRKSSKDQRQVVVVLPAGYRSGPEIRHALIERFGPSMVGVTTVVVPQFSPSADHETDDVDAILASSPYSYLYILPATPTEETLVQLLSSMLAEPMVISISDAVVDVGGDSLVAVELAEAIAEHFSLEIDSAEIFAAESLRDLATHIDTRSAA